METLVPESAGEEQEFLAQLLVKFVPTRLTKLVKEPSLKGTPVRHTVRVYCCRWGRVCIYHREKMIRQGDSETPVEDAS